ncbi:MAG: UbiA prenyltransferase family protein [Cryomorphaceae bacterium]|nr:UbiA prenyltransferase family protein [Cryomorphaceae bacterium]
MISTLTRALLHMRFHLSALLSPIFFMALCFSEVKSYRDVLLLFILLHLIVYPSRNGFNSIQDRIGGSLTGLKTPPPAPGFLRILTLILDATAIYIAFTMSKSTFILVTFYVIAFRAYSFRYIQLKRFPLLSFVMVVGVQGALIYLLTSHVAQQRSVMSIVMSKEGLAGILAACGYVAAGYPLLNLFRHKQEEKAKLKSFSRLLGIKDSFLFSTIFLAGMSLMLFYLFMPEWEYIFLFLLINSPTLGLFIIWYRKSWRTSFFVDYEDTMRISFLGGFTMNIFFIVVLMLEMSLI